MNILRSKLDIALAEIWTDRLFYV